MNTKLTRDKEPDPSVRPDKQATIQSNPAAELFAYQTDLWRRWVRYLDTLRQ